MAAIHARAMTVPAPWSVAALTGTRDAAGAVMVQSGRGFALGRVVLDEAELLTIAVSPEAQGQGLGRACLVLFETVCREKGATRILLEVAATNEPALRLYRATGFAEDGRRKGYYRAPGRTPIDAILMSKSLAPA